MLTVCKGNLFISGTILISNFGRYSLIGCWAWCWGLQFPFL